MFFSYSISRLKKSSPFKKYRSSKTAIWPLKKRRGVKKILLHTSITCFRSVIEKKIINWNDKIKNLYEEKESLKVTRKLYRLFEIIFNTEGSRENRKRISVPRNKKNFETHYFYVARILWSIYNNFNIHLFHHKKWKKWMETKLNKLEISKVQREKKRHRCYQFSTMVFSHYLWWQIFFVF